jgi:hypothetical protein
LDADLEIGLNLGLGEKPKLKTKAAAKKSDRCIGFVEGIQRLGSGFLDRGRLRAASPASPEPSNTMVAGSGISGGGWSFRI